MKLLLSFVCTAAFASLITYILCRQQWVPIQPTTTLPNGMQYTGQIINGVLSGQGELKGAGKERYIGHFENGLIEGEGEYWDPAGNYYKGDFVAGGRTGQGTMKFVDGSVYQGQFELGEFKGLGTLTFGNGELYEGHFENSVFSGDGVYHQSENIQFEGYFENGEIVKGKYLNLDTVYEGEFKDWMFHGEGTYTDFQGKSYQGTFDTGSLSGKGRIEYEDGAIYEGDIIDWVEHGFGKRIEANADIYTGEFEWGQYHGEGELKLAEPENNLSLLKGVWQWGQLENDPRDPPAFDYGQTEALLYSQNILLNEQANRLLSGRNNNIDIFALAVGAYGNQDVFLKEIEFIQPILENPNFAKNRSAYLVNNYQTTKLWPLATRTSLERTIKDIESKMDVNKDILFIYFTSHGSKDHQLSIQIKGIRLPDVSAEQFSQALSKSSIKWKVIIISACYSGGFIPKLADETSLIMTAARSDRTSFGCGDDSDMTYFGKAFFKEALPKANSFIDAFNTAKQLVWVREAAEFSEEKHSEPQIHIGNKIEDHLKQWRSQSQYFISELNK